MERGQQGREPTDAEWQALLARVPHELIYAVKTTGVACAFGCASRPPLRRNVLIYAQREEALANGFRACLRCAADVGKGK